MAKFSRRQFIKNSSALGAGLALGQLGLLSGCGSTRQPNVIIIYTDDQAFDTIAAYGGKVLTPNIDRLCREGAMFDRNYVSTPMCTPSRYTCLTGEYAGRNTSARFLRKNPLGKTSQPINNGVELRKDQVTIAKVLRDNGYATGMVGKWHLGEWIYGWMKDGKWTYPPGWKSLGLKGYPKDGDPADPETKAAMQHNYKVFCEEMKKYGFDDASGVYWANLLELQQDTLRKTHNLEWITKGAVNFIDKNKANPFFLYYSTTLHHGPHPRASLGKDANPLASGEGLLEKPVKGVMPSHENLKKRVSEAGLEESTAYCTWLDDGVGALLKKLEEHELTENTAIIFMGDNGYYGKSSLYEIGVNTPAAIWWPGKIKGGQRRKELVGNIDVTPTILDICGLRAPAEMHLDGTSLLPLVMGKTTQWRDAVYIEYGYARGVVTKEWKYLAIRYPQAYLEKHKAGKLKDNVLWVGGNKSLEKKMFQRNPNYYDSDQLYNLKEEKKSVHFDNLNEEHNLAKDPKYAGKLEEMKGKLARFLKTFPERPFGEFTE